MKGFIPKYKIMGMLRETLDKVQDTVSKISDMDTLDITEDLIQKIEADGCQGCAYESTEEWEMPCAKCSRGCKDYYRKGMIE